MALAVRGETCRRSVMDIVSVTAFKTRTLDKRDEMQGQRCSLWRAHAIKAAHESCSIVAFGSQLGSHVIRSHYKRMQKRVV